jgi:hypothetical protein
LNLIQALEPFTLRQSHVNELGVHSFDVGQHEQLFHGRILAHVAFESDIGVAPLLRRLAEDRAMRDA